MEKDNLRLIPIADLLDMNFFIPAYQRGYKWQERQVLDLLEDILEFQKKRNKTDGEFYCLQPLVVKKREEQNDYEVIDGQQRLTTIYLIQHYLNQFYIERNRKKLYKLVYKTRKDSWNFLKNKLDENHIDTSNSDFYHISIAYQTIHEWFKEQENKDNTFETYAFHIILRTFVKFIWYEAQAHEDAISIFTRINMGKIPLTNAELIKALFFVDNENAKQEELAYEWDNIEKTLQQKDFWYFLTNKKGTATRIEFIFNLIAKKYASKVNIEKLKETDDYYDFYIFNKLIADKFKIKEDSKTTKEQLWEEVKTYFRTFEEWFNNNEYYHLIGYLIQVEKSKIGIIKNLSSGKRKSEFRIELINLIKKEFKDIQIDKLNYNEHYSQISNLLLLFNVITTKNSKYTKFPFEKYVSENWSLEHIHAQNSENLKTDKQKRLLLEEQKVFFAKKEDFLKEIEEILKKDKIDDKIFENLQKKIFEKYSDDIDIHSIDNMALLSRDDNSALSNNIFPIKLDKIKEWDKQGKFIPICTKNVFFKYYSKDVEQNVQWEKADRESYLKAMKDTLKEFLILNTDENGK